MRSQYSAYFPFVDYYDEVLSPTICQEMIDLFEYDHSIQSQTILKDQYNFTEVTISDPNRREWVSYHNMMVDLTAEIFQEYIHTNKILHIQQPNGDFGFEQFRMKRYLPGQDQYFGLHCDVGNYASSRRYLAFLFYLNTVTEGGATVFRFQPVGGEELKIRAVEGRVLVFPPTWTHPHEGLPPVSGPKYILSGYIHYL